MNKNKPNKNYILSILFLVFSVSTFFAQEATQTFKKVETGLDFREITAQEKSFNAETNGVVILKVNKKKSKIATGDIITHVNNIEILDKAQIVKLFNEYPKNKENAKFTLLRNGVKMEITETF